MSKHIRRCLLVLPLLVVSVAVLAVPGGTAAQAETTNGPIAATALKYVGTHGGQCWTFMRQVVQEATGRTVGFDYRQGFFQAGAIEVTADQAQNGDIIQIDNDADTSPASYAPGQHTAIILQNLGGGVFNAVDSNQDWDEMVRLRPNYNPYAMAAASGLTVHIYHIPGGGVSDAANAALSTGADATTAWAAGDTGVVQADPGCLNIRAAAGLAQAAVDCLPTGTPVTVLDGPVSLDGYTWIEVQTPTTSGWVAANYVARTSTAPPVTTTSSSGQSAADASAVSASAGTPAHVDTSPGCLNVRESGAADAAVVGCLAPGSAITLLPDATVAADGYTWAHITDGSVTGWSATAYIVQ